MEARIIKALEEHKMFLTIGTIAKYSRLPEDIVSRELARLVAEKKILTRHVHHKVCYAIK